MKTEGGAEVVAAWERLERWGAARNWLGRDPYEGLNARFERVLTVGGRPLPRRLLIQAVKRSPVDLRPLLGIAPRYNAKAVALVASGYARGGTTSEHLREAAGWLDRLLELDVLSDPSLSAWGYHFPFQSRVFYYPRSCPNTIATSFAAHALLDGWERLGERRWLDAASRASAWLTSQMFVPATGKQHFRYVPGDDVLIHNASALAAATVARAAAGLGEAPPDEVGLAVSALARLQRPDGSWPYGERAGLEWIDHYHTGYVLEALEHCRRAGIACAEVLDRGFEFYSSRLFRADGLTPRWTAESELPLDTHCIAQAIDTFSAVAAHRPELVRRACAIAEQGIAQAGKPDGSYIFERRRLWTNRLALMRWTNAPMFRALGSLIQVTSDRSSGPAPS